MWLKLGATAVAAIVVAEGAAWLLRPREVIEPVAVDEAAYFPAEQVARATDYREGQRALMIGGIAAQGAVLVLLVAGRPGVARRALERAGERPVLGGAAAGAGLAVTLGIASLPFDVWAHERAADVGISTQDLGAWSVDWLKSAGIGAVLAGGVATAALALIRRAPRRWWVPGSAVVVALAAAFTWLAPVVLAPLFNDFEPLEEGTARADVLELGERADVEIGEVYRVDASRRSTAINAYVGGLGPTKRVVLYDTLLDDLGRGERRSVVAHELAHVENRDIPRALLFVAISAPLALLFVAGASRVLAARTGAEPGTPASLPALAIAFAAASFVVGVAGNQLSREVEAKADTDALELTADPQAMIALQQRLAARNLSDPSPPGWSRVLFGTHPTSVERIGMAEAYEEEQTSGGASSASRPGAP
ncbi:MAG TPA: M48 family metallopeptidase [Solirubrobacterales bacterium]|nr:M48 family metallopeptidase [Solirubrobacterales bacterium]